MTDHEMTRCPSCGEDNHDDARYCGTCGTSLPTAGGIGSLVADDVARDDDTAPGAGPGDDAQWSSEYVADPTLVVSPPPQTTTQRVAPPHAGPPPSGRPTPVVRSTRSTSVMIAALVAAALVIIGGVFILLASGPGSTNDASSVEDAEAPGVTLDTSAPATVTAAPSEAPAPETLPVATAPPPEVATTPAPTAAPAPATTEPPTPAPTAPSGPPAPSRGPGDLGLTQPILDELCDGRYITFVGSAVGDQPYDSVVSELLGLYPGTNYIWTKSCSSLRQEFVDGADIYGVVFGPYATQEEACDARTLGPQGAYVRRISTSDPPDHTIRC